MDKPKEEVKEEPAKEPVVEPSTPQEKASSPEVKGSSIDEEKYNKMQQQVDNLNIALKKEREEKGSKISEYEERLKKAEETSERMKKVFVPDDEIEDQPVYATQEDIEAVVQRKLKEIQEESAHSKKVEEYKTEITKMEKEWDGKDGKPTYNDEEVLSWQKSNGKTYLSPQEAFFQMKQSEIIDYSVKQKLAGSSSVENVEQPGITPGEHKPQPVPEVTPDMDTRKMALEAMEQADKEM